MVEGLIPLDLSMIHIPESERSAKNAPLSGAEQTIIRLLVAHKVEWKLIIGVIGKSGYSCRNFWKKRATYNQRRNVGRPKLLDARAERMVYRMVDHQFCKLGEVKRYLEDTDIVKSITKQCISDYVAHFENIKYAKVKVAPSWTADDKKARYDQCFEWAMLQYPWYSVIFSDEKRFNLDGPDGHSYYWQNVNKEALSRLGRQKGGGSVMVWAAISHVGKLKLMFCDNRMDAEKYTVVLRRSLLPFLQANRHRRFVFMQDNASVHTATLTEEWLNNQDIDTLPWPVKSADLNIIENVWSEMVRIMYANNRQYNSVDELKDAINRAWDQVAMEFIEGLYRDMHKRCCLVMKAQGGKIDR